MDAYKKCVVSYEVDGTILVVESQDLGYFLQGWENSVWVPVTPHGIRIMRSNLMVGPPNPEWWWYPNYGWVRAETGTDREVVKIRELMGLDAWGNPIERT